ncbi:flagellar basal body P-ring formation chaperone FlgA [Candidatus Liberibacter asiaticus]|uniref:Flagella basal body P-ring formation protein FlgA n=2 Tax=Liberibacter asiaticus TaxID=34021 RepID=C6XHV7_LIBAP|nr:flagellar basal body P-ring formation chaperone FlgA [Candidatus Liberibacter asiaticus]ACT56850.1 flagellar basal body P-ring biosynthesis protein FlgA [Candidatus Liberibacter asiaticus str. psy62]AGH16614.1 flagellar basal body P-ring biosynthesis protein FlgA [Candidatus Liberibacter asiaticus str. gxpsy]ALK07005.1 flagellar basal body P-ring formation protein FlgA [Candidatus Liberibacter asiaticus]ASK52476.1 flagella basal body P-ring formation protein FlgA [Candidatus Liberibacter asi
MDCVRFLLFFSLYVLSLDSLFASVIGHAVVPSVVINAGEVLNESRLKEMQVTNSNIRGNYAHSIKDVVGLVTRRVLLPDHVIPLSVLHRPYVISRGAKVRIILTQGNMTISTAGIALSDASIGDVIAVKNIDTGVMVSGSVVDTGTVRVVVK